jgi:hypothetical protein
MISRANRPARTRSSPSRAARSLRVRPVPRQRRARGPASHLSRGYGSADRRSPSPRRSQSEGRARAASPTTIALKILTSNAIRRPTMTVGVPARTARTAAFGNGGAVSRSNRGLGGAYDTDLSEATRSSGLGRANSQEGSPPADVRVLLLAILALALHVNLYASAPRAPRRKATVRAAPEAVHRDHCRSHEPARTAPAPWSSLLPFGDHGAAPGLFLLFLSGCARRLCGQT